MADGGIPNKHRADSALTIYRDAMRQYIAPILEREHGPNWIRSQVLNEQARERNERSYARRLQSLESGSPPHRLIDLADIPFVIDHNHSAFPTLDRADTARMHTIRDLRNGMQHSHGEGDCTREEADAVAGLCVLALERCGLSDAAKNIRGLSSAPSTPAVSEADLQKERARREWDKERLSAKPDEELTPLERQRLDDIAWEEEWERREQEHQERERRERERLERAQQERELRERKRRIQELGGRLSAGGYHSIGLSENRTIVGWGANDRGQRAAPAGKFIALSAGWRHSLGLREDGTVVGWGSNDRSQCAAPTGKFVAVSAGRSYSLGLREDRTVVGWGSNNFGGCDAPAGKFVAVSAGASHSLGLREDGTVVGWGSNNFGGCDAPAGKFVAVSAGLFHSLGLCEDGTVVGWGINDDGECDALVGKFIAVSVGAFHSLGLREDGTVVGWGSNDNGECDAPVGKFAAVSAGYGYSIGLREDGAVVGWGSNRFSQCDAPSDLRIR